MDKSKRQSNFELMRIVSMIFIVFYHFCIHGSFLSNCTNTVLKQILDILVCISLVHVNSFVLLSGYFQNKSKFKIKKITDLIDQTLFYRVLIVIFLLITNRVVLNKVQILEETALINLTQYWYVKIFFILYIISPYINKFINTLDQKEFKRLIIILFSLLSLIPFITKGLSYDNDGFGLVHFIFLYLVGAYINRYPIFKDKSVIKKRIIYISVFVICVLINKYLTDGMINIEDKNNLFKSISTSFVLNKLNYASPIIIIQTLSYFLLFETIDIKSIFINKVAEVSFAVYLIHDNQLLKPFVYKFFRLADSATKTSGIFYLFGAVFIMFIIGCIIEKVRITCIKKLDKTKIVNEIKNVGRKISKIDVQ